MTGVLLKLKESERILFGRRGVAERRQYGLIGGDENMPACSGDAFKQITDVRDEGG